MEETLQNPPVKNDAEAILTKRNLFCFPIGTFGRDMACSGLFAQLLNYIYFTKTVDAAMLSVVTILMTVIKAWDTLNDPMMGNIIDSTKSRFGKFKPWVFIGMLGSAGILLALFCNNLQGWDFVILFGVMYFLWTIFFTMNDIGYWGMIPSLATNPNDRNKLTSLTALCAAFGGGVCGIVIPMFTTGALAINGNAIDAYRILTIIFVAVFIVFQMITVIGVDNKQMAVSVPQEKFKFSHIFLTLKNNKQVLWASLAFFFTQLMPNAAITMFVYFQYGYNGTLTTLVAIFNGLFTVLVYIFFSKFSKKYSRRQIFTFSYICGMVGYGLMILFALVIPNVIAFHVPFFEIDITYQFMLEAVAYGLVGLSGCTSYLICSISITNCVEYNEYLSGKRDEGIVYSMRTFIVSLGVTFINLIIMLFYIIIGIERYTDQISALEQAANLGTIDTSLGTKDEQIANVINNTPHLQVILLITFVGGFAMLMLTAAYIIYMKKYKITESRYDKIMAILEARHNNVEEPEVLEDLEKVPK